MEKMRLFKVILNAKDEEMTPLSDMCFIIDTDPSVGCDCWVRAKKYGIDMQSAIKHIDRYVPEGIIAINTAHILFVEYLGYCEVLTQAEAESQ